MLFGDIKDQILRNAEKKRKEEMWRREKGLQKEGAYL